MLVKDKKAEMAEQALAPAGPATLSVEQSIRMFAVKMVLECGSEFDRVDPYTKAANLSEFMLTGNKPQPTTDVVESEKGEGTPEGEGEA